MPVLLVERNLIKVACHSCIKGHRSKTCKHWDRVLIELRRPGRPQAGCQHASLDPECKCNGRSAYYVPGHQPRFASTSVSGQSGEDDGPVVVNAVAHHDRNEPPAYKPKVKSAKLLVLESPSISSGRLEAGSTAIANARVDRSADHSQSNVNTIFRMHANPALEASSRSQPGFHETALENIPGGTGKPHGQSVGMTPSSQRFSCCQDSGQSLEYGEEQDTRNESAGMGGVRERTSRLEQSSQSNYIPRTVQDPALLRFQQSLMTLTPGTGPGSSGASNRPFSTSLPDHQRLVQSRALPPPPYESTLYTSSHSRNSGSMPLSGFPVSTNDAQWQTFPVFDSTRFRIQDQCSCTDEAHCLCPGCTVHPRNRATMQMVFDALDYQDSESYRLCGESTRGFSDAPSEHRNMSDYSVMRFTTGAQQSYGLIPSAPQHGSFIPGSASRTGSLSNVHGENPVSFHPLRTDQTAGQRNDYWIE